MADGAWTPRGAHCRLRPALPRGHNPLFGVGDLARNPARHLGAIDAAVWTALYPGGAPNDHSVWRKYAPGVDARGFAAVHGGISLDALRPVRASDSLPRCRIQRRLA